MTGPHFYPQPSMSPATHSIKTLAERLRRFDQLCAEHGVATRNTRIDRYRRYLEQPQTTGWELDRGVFIDPPHSPISNSMDRRLYVLREVHELAWIGESLTGLDVRGLSDKLQIIVSGADFAVLDQNHHSRNTQFELRIASYLARAGYQLDLGTLTDIVATRDHSTFYVECKRVASASQFAKRVKEGASQITDRMPRSGLLHARHGFVAVDATRIAFTRNGLFWAITPDHARDVLRGKLQDVKTQLEKSNPSEVSGRVVGVWLHMHFPCLILNPPIPSTYFSSTSLIGRNLNLRARYAVARLMSYLITAGVEDSGDDPIQPLEIRNNIQIPQGTRVQFDEEILEALVATGNPPERPYDQVVLRVWPPGAGQEAIETYNLFELGMALGSLSSEDRRRFTESLEEARSLVAPLILQRYRYVAHVPWLDDRDAHPPQP